MEIAVAEPAVVVLGSLNMDIVLQVDHLPRPGETLPASSVRNVPGGKGANQAVAARRAGAGVRMIGAVGADAFGDALLDVMAGEGIDARIRGADAATGTAYVAVDGAGENCIIISPGANATVAPADIPVDNAPHGVWLSQLEVPVDSVAAFFAAAPAGATRMLNAAPFVAVARACFASADIVCVNETELAAYCDDAAAADADPVAQARTLIVRPGQTIIVTLGEEGALAVTSDDVVRVPAFPARVVDTTGAGDCFCGIVAASLAAGMALPQALARAAKGAALAVGKPGAIPSLPTAEMIDAL